MVKKGYFPIIGLLVLPSLALADEPVEAQRAKTDAFTLSGYTEAGKKSTAEDYEEEDTDDDYTYHNYHLKFWQKVSGRLTLGFVPYVLFYKK